MHTWELNRNSSCDSQDIWLTKSDFKSAIINGPKPHLQKLKETVTTLTHQITIKMQKIKKESNWNSRTVIAVIEMKKGLSEELNSRYEQPEERIRTPEDSSIEIIYSKQHNEKRLRKNEQSLRDLWDRFMHIFT